MIRSDDFERLVTRDLAAAPTVRRVEAAVDTVQNVHGGAEILAYDAAGDPCPVSARWVFDSRPLGGLPAARTTLLQHFHGWFVHTERVVFDPLVAEFMDFRTPQPAKGLSFGYVLPTGPHHALVEYTEFSPTVLSPRGYESALRRYTQEVLGLGRFAVVGTETGVIPMTDAVFARRTGESVFRIGAAG